MMENDNAGSTTQEENAGNTSQETLDAQNKGSNSWAEVFPDKTPQQVAEELGRWKTQSRKWERQSKSNKEALDSALARTEEGVESATSDLQARITTLEESSAKDQEELAMYRDLISLGQATGAQFQVAELTDSLSFREAYSQLDRESDTYADDLKKIVDARTGPQPSRRPAQEAYAGEQKNTGEALFNRLYGKNS